MRNLSWLCKASLTTFVMAAGLAASADKINPNSNSNVKSTMPVVEKNQTPTNAHLDGGKLSGSSLTRVVNEATNAKSRTVGQHTPTNTGVEGGVAGGNDDCGGATPIGDGTTNFDNTGATTSPEGSPCGLFGADLWYRYTATCDGLANATTCLNGISGLDTVLAVYDGCNGNVIICDDDGGGCPGTNCGFSGSSCTWLATAGTEYLIRVGGYNGCTSTAGTLTLSCTGGGGGTICTQPSGNCTLPLNNANAYNSNAAAGWLAADDFTGSGVISEICWWGTEYPAQAAQNDFTVTYYDSVGNLPGNVICGPYSQSGGSLTVASTLTGGLIAGIAPESEYTGAHGACTVNGDCYWVSVQNNVADTAWYWENGFTGNNRFAQNGAAVVNVTDLAFCLSIALGDSNNCLPPVGSVCTLSCSRTGDQSNAYNSTLGQFVVEDDFSASGTITDLCWRGGYLPNQAADDFTVTYYDCDGAGGLGGVICGPYSQSGGSLAVSSIATGGLIAGFVPEIEYAANHSGCAVNGGAYWLEIINAPAGGVSWYWELGFGGNGRSLQNGANTGFDMYFCLNTGTNDPDGCNVAPPANDDCGNCESITGEGVFPYNNEAATTDGAVNASCDFAGDAQIYNDVWFCWTATCDSDVRIETCNNTTTDSKLAVYAPGWTCPPGDADKIVCNDDACGLQSRVQFTATAGTTYLIRAGTYGGTTGGASALTITCVVVGNACTLPAENCHPLNNANAYNSTLGAFVSADDFRFDERGCCPGDVNGDGAVNNFDIDPFVTAVVAGDYLCAADLNCDGAVNNFDIDPFVAAVVAGTCGGPCPGAGQSKVLNDVCWWGGYISSAVPDSFTVTYYDSNGGFPGNIICGPFSEAGGSLTVNRALTGGLIAGFVDEYSYGASHADCVVNKGECYWLEVVNDVAGQGANWYWENGFNGNNRFVQNGAPVLGQTDLAFCVDKALGDESACLPPAPPGDSCETAFAISGTGDFAFDNTGAAQNGPSNCGAMGADVFYCWTASCDGVATVSTCGLTSVDTVLNIYDGCSCFGTSIVCLDDFCGLQTQVSFNVVSGNQYLIQLGGFGGSQGAGMFNISCSGGGGNTDDDCTGATAVAVPSTTLVDTSTASPDPTAPTCTTTVTAAGRWLTFTGNGGQITVTTCNNGTTYDTKLNVYSGTCTALTCVAGNDDGGDESCDCPNCGGSNYESRVIFASTSGTTYYVLVQGFGGATGTAQVDITSP